MSTSRALLLGLLTRNLTTSDLHSASLHQILPLLRQESDWNTPSLIVCKLPSPPSRSFPPRCRLAIWVIFSTSRLWLLQHLRLCNTSISSSSPPFITPQSLLGAFGDSVLRLLKDAPLYCVVHPATYNLCQVHTYLLYLCHHLSTTQRHGSSLCKRLPSSWWPLPV